MERSWDKYKALLAALGVHLLLFLLAAAFGVFPVAKTQQAQDDVEVAVLDAAPDEGSEGGGSPPETPATPAADPVVIPDKTLPPTEDTPAQDEKASRAHEAQKGSPFGRGGEGGGEDTGTGNAKGPGTGGNGGGIQKTEPPPPPPPPAPEPPPPPAPPKERIQASLRAEARPEYPPELIDEDVEGSVTIKIFVAADGTVEDVRVISSSGYAAMDNAAVAAGYRFTFNPGDGGARGTWTKTFYFHLE